MDELQSIPNTPEIRKRTPRPEISGILPPKPDKLPGEDRPEVNDDDDNALIIPPPLDMPDPQNPLPGADHDDDDKQDPPPPTLH